VAGRGKTADVPSVSGSSSLASRGSCYSTATTTAQPPRSLPQGEAGEQLARAYWSQHVPPPDVSRARRARRRLSAFFVGVRVVSVRHPHTVSLTRQSRATP
jgi:hypothetical protein